MRYCQEERCLEIIQGDITAQTTDAVVNAANKALAPGGGVAGAIHRTAGPGLWEESSQLGGCETGEAKITQGHNLPARYIIHTVGPVYGQDEPAAELLARCYRRSLEVADQNGLESIAFPALSTGAFGYPLEEAARIALQTLFESLPQQGHLKLVRMVLYGKKDLEAHETAAQDLAPGLGWESA